MMDIIDLTNKSFKDGNIGVPAINTTDLASTPLFDPVKPENEIGIQAIFPITNEFMAQYPGEEPVGAVVNAST